MELSNLKRMSNNIVKIAIDNYITKNNEMALYLLLLGKGNYKIEAFPDAGHNFYEVLNSFYEYKKNYSDINVEKILEDALNVSISNICKVEDFAMVMNYIFTELDNEKNNISPFKIDILEILNNLRERIQSFDKFKNNILFEMQLKKSEDYLNKKYGHKIF